MSAIFAARFPGECASCGERIRVGDGITWSGTVVVHSDCDDATPDRPVTICPTCYLTSCDCGATS